MLNNFKSIKNVDDTRNNLTYIDIYRQNRSINKYASKKEKRNVDKKISTLELEEIKENAQKEITQAQEELKLQQVKNTAEKEMLQQKIEVLQDTAELKDFKNMQKDGKRFGRKNTLFILISCITSMFGLGMVCTNLNLQELLISWSTLQNLQYIAIGVLFFIVEQFVSYISNKQHVILENFNDRFMYCVYGFMMLVYGTSIYSNFYFWYGISKSLVVGIVYAIAFDVGSYIASYYKDKFTYLRFNKKQVDNTTGKQVTKTSQSMENKGIDVNTQTDKKQVINNKKMLTLTHSSKGKMTCKRLQELIDNNFSDGQVIEPKQVNMTGNSNFKNWMPKMQNVQKNNDGKYIKLSSNNFKVVSNNDR